MDVGGNSKYKNQADKAPTHHDIKRKNENNITFFSFISVSFFLKNVK